MLLAKSTFPLFRLSAMPMLSALPWAKLSILCFQEHFIEWIALEAEGRLEIHYLKPGQAPSTFFAGGIKSGTVFAYCNLHGLWSASF